MVRKNLLASSRSALVTSLLREWYPMHRAKSIDSNAQLTNKFGGSAEIAVRLWHCLPRQPSGQPQSVTKLRMSTSIANIGIRVSSHGPHAQCIVGLRRMSGMQKQCARWSGRFFRLLQCKQKIPNIQATIQCHKSCGSRLITGYLVLILILSRSVAVTYLDWKLRIHTQGKAKRLAVTNLIFTTTGSGGRLLAETTFTALPAEER